MIFENTTPNATPDFTPQSMLTVTAVFKHFTFWCILFILSA